ncbi:YkvA family protein [Arthrobacter roseus]
MLLAVLGGLVLLYAILLILLWAYARKHPETVSMKDALRLLPDLLRLIKRLAGDSSIPAGVRIRLVLLLVYLASPIDLVPDFLPVIGYADDVVIVALVLRSVVRHAGASALERHWPGTAQGLDLIKKLAGTTAAQ